MLDDFLIALGFFARFGFLDNTVFAPGAILRISGGWALRCSELLSHENIVRSDMCQSMFRTVSRTRDLYLTNA